MGKNVVSSFEFRVNNLLQLVCLYSEPGTRNPELKIRRIFYA